MVEIITQPNGLERRGGRALRHHPARDRPHRHGRPRPHPLAVALRPLGREVLLHLDADYHTAQQRVLNRLSFVSLPRELTPQLSPWNAIGEVFRYRCGARATRSSDLKTAEDWILERQFTPGPGRHRRRRLRRRDQAVPRRGRPLPAEGPRRHADAAHQRHRQRQPERRRRHAHRRRAVLQRARDGPHPLRCATSATSPSPRRRGRPVACATWPTCTVGAAPRLGIVGQRRRARRRPGHRADALRRRVAQAR